jgi:hypothetical protein
VIYCETCDVCDVYVMSVIYIYIYVMLVISVIYIFCLFGWNAKKQIKKTVFGHFAECFTRQRVSLPSVLATTLGKVTILGTWETSFAKCSCQDTRQT